MAPQLRAIGNQRLIIGILKLSSLILASHLATLMTCSPMSPSMTTNSTSVIPTIANHRLNTEEFSAMSGVGFREVV